MLQHFLMTEQNGGKENPYLKPFHSSDATGLFAALGRYMVVFGGHASGAGWFRSRTVLYHNDCVFMDRQGSVQWRALAVEGEPPAPREFHTLTALSPTRLLLFGGTVSPHLSPPNIAHSILPLCIVDRLITGS